MRLRLRVERLAELLGASRLSQNHWALKLGLSRGHWSDIVNGRHPFPSAKTRERMLEVFAVTADELFVADTESRAGETFAGDSAPTEVNFRQAIATQYEITEELGQGGMGTVYLANDRALGRVVAIKVVAQEAAAGIGADQLLMEIAHVARLQHPNILPLHEAGECLGHPYYVMPFIREGSLGAMLKRRVRLSLGEVVEIVNALARGLEYAHARQVLHCDIKPENILIQDGHPYLMDFGIARKLHSEAEEWIGLRKELDYSAGTPAYVSPEQASGDKQLDQRSDVYSFACVVYEMLSGRAPFAGTTTQEIVAQRFRSPAPSPRNFAPELSQPVCDVISRAMSIDPARRPPSASAFAAELQSASVQAASASSRALSVVSLLASRSASRLRATAGLSGPYRLTTPMYGLLNELRYAARSVHRHWRFSLGVILSLGLGVGLGIPVLSIADHLFLRPPPGVSEPERVAKLVSRSRLNDGRVVTNEGLTGLDYETTLRNTQTLEGVAGWINLGLSQGRGAEARSVNVTIATASFFPVLGVRPALGRFYTDREDVEGVTAAPAVVSHRYWKTYFGGTPDVLGKTLNIGAVDYTVVGVAPEGFNGLGLNAVDLWLPVHVAAPEFQGRDPKLWTTDQSAWLRLVARIKPGVSLAVASSDANRAYRMGGVRVRNPNFADPMLYDPLQPGRSSNRSQASRIALWLSGGAAMLLLLVAANVVNLFLARNAANARQVAIRLAIGGGGRQLLRLHALEALLLGVYASLFGLAVSYPAVKVARALIFPGVNWVRPALDVRVALLAFAIAACIGVLVSAWTTLHARRVDPADLMRAAGTAQMAGTRRSHRARRALLVSQAAILAVLLSGSAAFVLSLRRATAVDVGFDIHHLLAASIPLSGATTTTEQSRQLYDRALEQLQAMPQVASATLAYVEPWQNNRFETVSVPGREGAPPLTLFDVATPEYLNTFGVRLHEGRWIESVDREGTAPIIVINQSLATFYWPTGSVVGKCIRIGADSLPCRTIVGVVRDFRMTGGVDGPMAPAYWLPLAQAQSFRWVARIFFRARGDEAQAIRAVRNALQSLQAGLPLVDVHQVRRNVEWLTTPLQLGSAVFTAFGVLAAIVAAVGLYSVLSFLIVEQRRTHAIKVALGAASWNVAMPVVRQAVVLVGLGLSAGFVVVALLGSRFESMLFHTSAFEPRVALVVATFGALVTVVASLSPVRTVLRTDAMQVLRDQ